MRSSSLICFCDVVYNDVTRDSKTCSLTLRHVTENRYVKYPVHNSWRYESIILTNRIAGKRMNIKKIKLYKYCRKFPKYLDIQKIVIALKFEQCDSTI